MVDQELFNRLACREPRVSCIRMIAGHPYIAVGKHDNHLMHARNVPAIDEVCPECRCELPVMLFNEYDNGYFCHECHLHWWWAELICPECGSQLVDCMRDDLVECVCGCMSVWPIELLLMIYDQEKYL